MSRFYCVIALLLISFGAQAQISTPEKTKFNVGIYAGLSIWKYKPMAALDINYKGTTLRLMPNYQYYAVGLTQEIAKISPVFYNLYWTGSVYGGYGFEYVSFPSVYPDGDVKKTTYTGVVNTGLKTYFGRRWYTHIMGGVMYTKSNVPNVPKEENVVELSPYFEFGIGFLFKKTYPVLKREETEE